MSSMYEDPHTIFEDSANNDAGQTNTRKSNILFTRKRFSIIDCFSSAVKAIRNYTTPEAIERRKIRRAVDDADLIYTKAKRKLQ